MRRREFLAAAGAAAVARPAWAGAALSETRIKARPFELGRVRLRAGPFLAATDVNRRYMMGLEPHSLLHTFRLTAGLPSAARPLGGWESPDNELRGHFAGHYLSACAIVGASTGDEALRARGNELVAELAKCQQAHGNGYLSAFPEELFDRLREGKSVWAPFYTLHKIMAGLRDTYVYSGNPLALDVLKRMATWTERWTQPLGDAHMARVLEREYGGMNEVLYDLSALTGEASHRALAHRFDHERIFAPLAAGRDELKGLHVNTTIPKIIGAARRYELTGEPRSKEIAEYFWREVTERRCYCTGGTSNEESWNSEPGQLAKELGGYTQECCVTYNMLKLTRHVFQWTADPRCADYYERALLNGILGTQHPSDGMTVYYVPLASGYWKLFGLPRDAFWCCTGSGLESFAKLADSVYFHDDQGLFVNLFVASEVDWPEKGVRVVQDTRFPEDESTALVIRCHAPVRMSLRVRVPAWATSGAAKLNGRALETFASAGSYFVLDRTWKDGDKVEITLPMRLHLHPMPDDASVAALMYGPIVLAGRLGRSGLTPENLRAEPTKPRTVPEYKSEPVPAPSLDVPSADPADWVTALPGKALAFRTTLPSARVDLAPLYEVIDERYAVYWKVTRTV